MAFSYKRIMAAEHSKQARLLSELRDLRVDRQTGVAAVYQQVVLLRAISRAVKALPRLESYSAAAPELQSLLRPFAVASTQPDPALPWAALRATSWWELQGQPLPPGRPRDAVKKGDLRGGLHPDVYDLMRDDPSFRTSAIDVLCRTMREPPALKHFLQRLQLSGADESRDMAPVPADGAYVVEDVYDRSELHATAKRAGLPPGNATEGITTVGRELCVFWNPFKTAVVGPSCGAGAPVSTPPPQDADSMRRHERLLLVFMVREVSPSV
ncbi:hypothetical protein [Kineococcus radiotolerans]|uniref:ScoMcrA-like DNA sulfur-binding domain-containing protein n=1 Tax=Kineococcus radiotolerans (strain ATCC BAA-149 / DSM 14245 / SRS30216) TaxID=266940 RepID=A6W691_KINRD|nr:hypothetical protein [Kineococcus radiotolerans]ABS02330.1 hypothetical protein Krad_0842 [Kineococcus radiotolerans SRS30216 = ATCC BAA-149]